MRVNFFFFFNKFVSDFDRISFQITCSNTTYTTLHCSCVSFNMQTWENARVNKYGELLQMLMYATIKHKYIVGKFIHKHYVFGS